MDPGVFYGIGGIEDAFPSVPLSCVFDSENDGSLIAYWLPWHGQEYLPKLATISLKTQKTFSDPVLVDLLDGSVYKLTYTKTSEGTAIFENIPLADYPFVIVEKHNIQLKNIL